MKNRRESGIAAESDKNSDTGKLGYLNRLRGSFFPGGSLFQHRLSGGRELPQAGSPLTGRRFSLNLSGECAYPAGAQEGRHLRFPPSCESPLSLG